MTETISYQDFEYAELDRAQEQLTAFIMNPGWDHIAAPFLAEGQRLDPDNPRTRLAQLSEISDANWDFRKGKERHEVEWDQGELNDPESEVGRQIMAGGDLLGMIQSSKAPAGHYDMAIVLGGGMTSIPQRTEHLLSQEHVTYDRLVYLASTRRINDKEKKPSRILHHRLKPRLMLPGGPSSKSLTLLADDLRCRALAIEPKRGI